MVAHLGGTSAAALVELFTGDALAMSTSAVVTTTADVGSAGLLREVDADLVPLVGAAIAVLVANLAHAVVAVGVESDARVAQAMSAVGPTVVASATHVVVGRFSACLERVGARNAGSVPGRNRLTEEVQVVLWFVSVEEIDEHAAGDRRERVSLEQVANDRVNIDRSTIRILFARYANAAADVFGQVNIGTFRHRVLNVRVLDLDLFEAEVDLIFPDGISNELANVVGDADAAAVVVI